QGEPLAAELDAAAGQHPYVVPAVERGLDEPALPDAGLPAHQQDAGLPGHGPLDGRAQPGELLVPAHQDRADDVGHRLSLHDGGTRPSRWATPAASTRPPTPSLARMLDTCTLA